MNNIFKSFSALLVLLFVFEATEINAQDLIKTVDGKIIKVRLIDVNEERILYKDWENIEGEDQSMDSEQVDYVRYERSGSSDNSSYDEKEYDYDPLANHKAQYAPTEDIFYTGALAGIALPIGYYNNELNTAGYYAEYFIAYDFRGYNRIKLDAGYMHIPTNNDLVREAILSQNPQLSSSDLLDVSYTGDRVFYFSGGSTSEIFFDKWSFNINPRIGLVVPRDQVISFDLAGALETGREVTETRFGWMNGLAVNARYRLSENLVLNGSALYWDGVYQYYNFARDSFEVTGIRTINAGIGISYSIPY